MLRSIFVLGVLTLSSCGQPEPTATEDPIVEIDGDKAPDALSEGPTAAGMMPPGPVFAEDGDTIQAAKGDEISIKLELPDKVGTNNAWQLLDNTWPENLSWGNTWMSIEGSKRYSDIIVNAEASGRSDLTFVRIADGQQTDDRVTVTVIVK